MVRAAAPEGVDVVLDNMGAKYLAQHQELLAIEERLVSLASRAGTAPRAARQERTALERRQDMARRRRERILQIGLPPGSGAGTAESRRRPAGAG